jgi:hypothetical protein
MVTMHENRGFEENIEKNEMVSTKRELMNLSRHNKEETNFNSKKISSLIHWYCDLEGI